MRDIETRTPRKAVNTSPAVGDRAPDAMVTGPGGERRALADQWGRAPRATVVVFLRHFG